MNHLKKYIEIIRFRQKNPPNTQYSEKHHIFPISIYGGRKTNKLMVSLTAKEHYIVHHLLYKAFLKRYGKEHIKTTKMQKALGAMSNPGRNGMNSTDREYITSNARRYEYCKTMLSDAMKLNHHKPMLGRKFTEEHKQKLSELNRGPNNRMFGKIHTEETRKKIKDKANSKSKEEKDQITCTHYLVQYCDGTEETVVGKVNFLKRKGINRAKFDRYMKSGMACDGIVSLTPIGGKMYRKPRGPMPEEHRQKISESKKNYKKTEEHSRRQSEGQKGRVNSLKQRESVRHTHTAIYRLTFENGQQEVVENLSEWCRERGISSSNFLTHGHSKGIRAKIEKIAGKAFER